MIKNKFNFDLADLKLIHRVDTFYELNAFVPFYINENKNNLMNDSNSIFARYYDH